MKFLIKLSIIISLFTGYYLCTYDNYFSEFLYKAAFCIENTKEYINHIVLQNKHINNSTTKTNTSELMNEHFITIFDENCANHNMYKTLNSSNFSILNLKENEFNEDLKNSLNFLRREDVLLIENETNSNNNLDFQTLNENLYRFFKYDDFSIAYLKPKLLNNKNLLSIYKYLHILENNFYIPIVLIDKSNLNENLLKSISHKKSLFIVLDDNFSISSSKNIPILHTGSFENFNLFFQINLFISDSSLKKVRFKIFPIDIEGNTPSKENFQQILDNFNTNYKFKFHFNENVDYIYFDCDILKNSY